MIPAVYKDNEGNWRFNETSLHVRPYWLTTQPDTLTFPAAAIGSNSGAFPMNTGEDAVFLGKKFLGVLDDGATPPGVPAFSTSVRIYDDSTGRWIAPRWVHWATIVGTARRPFILPDEIILDPSASLSVQFQKRQASGINDQVKFYVEGFRTFLEDAGVGDLTEVVDDLKVRQRASYLTIKPTDTSPVVIAAGLGTVIETLRVPTNFHFTVKKITACLADGTAPGAAGWTNFEFRITDERGNRLSGDWLDAAAVLGDAQEPEILPQPWTIHAGRQARIEFRDLSGAPNTFYITFTGAAQYLTGAEAEEEAK